MGELDPSFIQDIEYRPTLKVIEPEEVPVIDFSIPEQQLISEIRNACKKWGFFQIINHGVPLELCERIRKTAREFFDKPMEEKKLLQRDEVNPTGYYDSEHTKNVRDWKEIFDFLLEDPTFIPASADPDDDQLRTIINRWPENYPGFRETCEEYSREVEKLGYRLFELIALSLGLPGDRFFDYFKGAVTFCRFNHYPPCPNPDLALGVGRHRDFDALTVLDQDDVGGLEIKRKSDGAWVSVKPIPNAYIINIGDCIQVWSNDAYESVEHRVVVNTEKARLSIPIFFFPAPHATLKPLDELLNENNPPKYRSFNFGKFFATRNRSDFKKREVENIQIHHFKISE